MQFFIHYLDTKGEKYHDASRWKCNIDIQKTSSYNFFPVKLIKLLSRRHFLTKWRNIHEVFYFLFSKDTFLLIQLFSRIINCYIIYATFRCKAFILFFILLIWLKKLKKYIIIELFHIISFHWKTLNSANVFSWLCIL